MIPIDQALDRLLHQRAYRQAFLDDDHAQLDVSADDLAALLVLDRDQLAATAERIADEVLRRAHRGTGSLLDVFPQTVAAWIDDVDNVQMFPLRELGFRLVGSAAYEGYRASPFAGLGQSLEETFFQFCEAEAIGHPTVREHEHLAAIVRALAVTPNAAFTLPAGVRRVPGGAFAVSERADPVLYAAVNGRYVTGPITPFLAELLLSTDEPDVVATRHGVTAGVLAESQATLAGLGLGLRP